MNIYNSIVKNITLYGAETWKITEKNDGRLMTVEMNALRRSFKVFRPQHTKYKEI